MSRMATAERLTEAPPPSESAGPPAPPRAFIRQHPVLAFSVLAFAISWGGVALAAAPPASMSTTARWGCQAAATATTSSAAGTVRVA